MCRSAKVLQCLQSNALVSFKVDSASPAYVRVDLVQQKGRSCLEPSPFELSYLISGSFTSECLLAGTTTCPCVHHQALQAACKRTLLQLQLPSTAPGGDLPVTDSQRRVQPPVSVAPAAPDAVAACQSRRKLH
jgi:hypothetical protein